MTGNAAAGYAAKLARVRAGIFFPIGPADEVIEEFRRLIDMGLVEDAEVTQLENEKACLSCQIGLARAGIRSMFSTCAEGLVWPASEIKYASGSRLPLLIVCPSRALSPPTTQYCDQEDFIMQRDMGWLLFYCENSQDILDTIIQAYRIAEDKRVMLPAIVGYDGWDISHASYPVSVPEQEKVDRFLPPRTLSPVKDYFTIDWVPIFKQRRQRWAKGEYMDKKYSLMQSLEDSVNVIDEVGREYKELFGRDYVGTIESYMHQDADIIVITMGIMTPLVRFAVNALRKKGIKLGLVKLRVFRPFPRRAILDAVENAKLIVTIERNSLGAVLSEVKSALYGSNSGFSLPVMGKIVGIGGRGIRYGDISYIISDAINALETGKAEPELEWVPIKSLDFDPFEDEVGE